MPEQEEVLLSEDHEHDCPLFSPDDHVLSRPPGTVSKRMEWEALRAGAQDARSEVTFAQPGLPRDVRLAFDEHRASRTAPQAAGPAAPDNFFVGTTNNMPDAMRFAEQGVAVNLRGSSTSVQGIGAPPAAACDPVASSAPSSAAVEINLRSPPRPKKLQMEDSEGEETTPKETAGTMPTVAPRQLFQDSDDDSTPAAGPPTAAAAFSSTVVPAAASCSSVPAATAVPPAAAANCNATATSSCGGSAPAAAAAPQPPTAPHPLLLQYEEERKNHYHRTKPTPGFDLSQHPDLAKGLGRVYSKNVYCYATENYGPSRAAPPPQVPAEAASSSALLENLERTPSPKQKKRKEKPESEDYVFELPTVGTVNGLSKFARIVLDRIRARTEREVITPFFSQVQPIVMVPAPRGVVGEEGVVGGGDAPPAVVARRLGARKQLYRKDVGLMESDEQRVRAFGLLCAGTTGSQSDQASSGAAAKISPPPASGCDYYMKPLHEYQQILDLHKAARENQQSAKSKSTSEDYRSASSRSVSKEEVSAGVAAAPVVQPQPAQFLPLASLSSRSVNSANASRAASTSASAAPSAAASAPQSKGPSPTATRSPTAFQPGARFPAITAVASTEDQNNQLCPQVSLASPPGAEQPEVSLNSGTTSSCSTSAASSGAMSSAAAGGGRVMEQFIPTSQHFVQHDSGSSLGLTQGHQHQVQATPTFAQHGHQARPALAFGAPGTTTGGAAASTRTRLFNNVSFSNTIGCRPSASTSPTSPAQGPMPQGRAVSQGRAVVPSGVQHPPPEKTASAGTTPTSMHATALAAGLTTPSWFPRVEQQGMAPSQGSQPLHAQQAGSVAVTQNPPGVSKIHARPIGLPAEMTQMMSFKDFLAEEERKSEQERKKQMIFGDPALLAMPVLKKF